MKKEEKKPELFELYIEGLFAEGISANALVERPANEFAFLTFSEQEEAPIKISFSDEEKRLVTGVLLAPEQRIYRRDGEREYYVYFTEEQILKLAKAAGKNNVFNAVNDSHDSKRMLAGIYLMEMWITQGENERGLGAPKGSLMATYFVENDSIWSDLKARKWKGFSIEGLFRMKPAETTKEVFTSENETPLYITSEDNQMEENVKSEQEVPEVPATPEVKFEEAAPEAPEAPKAEEKNDVQDQLNALAEKLDALVASVSALSDKVNGVSEKNEEFASKIEKLSAVPAATTLKEEKEKSIKASFNKEVKNPLTARLLQMQKSN